MLWIKSFHLIFMVTWFSGLFYLPRLYVYHAMSTDSISIERFKIMERKLYYGIMLPGALLTLGFGLWLLYLYAWPLYKTAGWLHTKLTLVGLLMVYHLYLGHVRKQLRDNKNTHSPTFYRWLNEFPALLLIVCVILAVVKPF